MVGKTSLIKTANKELENAGIKAVYVNLWSAKGTRGLLNALAQGFNQERSLLQRIKGVAERIEGISFGPGGISMSVSKKPMTTIWDLLAAMGQQADQCVIELDEVQELSVISGHLLKLLANIFNTHPNVVFIFTGSMFGLVKTLLEPKSTSPLYGRSPAKIYLQPFTTKTAKEFLKKGLQEHREIANENFIEEAVERLDGIPGWLTLYGNNVAVQRLSHARAKGISRKPRRPATTVPPQTFIPFLFRTLAASPGMKLRVSSAKYFKSRGFIVNSDETPRARRCLRET
jgi:AAA+ ATPase superfamily predicted ATPase